MVHAIYAPPAVPRAVVVRLDSFRLLTYIIDSSMTGIDYVGQSVSYYMVYKKLDDIIRNGLSAGIILDGIVLLDKGTGEYVILDEDGEAYSIQSILASMVGKRIRFTTVTFETLETLERMLSAKNDILN